MFIDSFLPWYSVSSPSYTVGGIKIGGVSLSRNGWQSPGSIWSILATLIAIAMVAQIVVTKLKLAKLPDKLGNFSWAQVHLIGGVAAVVLVVIKWLNEHDFIGFGFWLGLLAAAGLAAGGYLLSQQSSSAEPPAPPAP
jgi:hypothetical protein